MPTRGYDAFFPDPGTFESMTCKVCGACCTVTRARVGPSTFAEAMLHAERPHDRFVCPHADLPWHNDALQLLREIEAETDPVLISGLRIRLRWSLQAHRDM